MPHQLKPQNINLTTPLLPFLCLSSLCLRPFYLIASHHYNHMRKDPHPHSLLSLKPFSIFLRKVLKIFTSGNVWSSFPQCDDCLLLCLPIFPISSPFLSGN